MTSERLLNVELDALVKSRDEYIAMVSHEVRTPVQNIGLGLQCIDQSGLNDTQSEMLTIAKASADHLETLVSDILSDTTIGQHAIAPKSFQSQEALNLRELIATVCRGFQAAAQQKNISFSYTIDEGIPGNVCIDGLRVKQVLYNLIGNAVKYTESGSISVATTKKVLAGQPHFQIIVKDTGIGISAEQQSKIFEPYATVGAKSKNSSGLGLALSNRFVAVMGGKLQVTSQLGHGSEFTISLPLITAEESATPHDFKTTHEEKWHLDSNRILLIDDNEMVRQTFAASLTNSGYEVTQASDGLEALRMVEKSTFLAVVTDLQMPQMNGFELVEALLNLHTGSASRPINILITGTLSREITTRGTELFDGVLFKPVRYGKVAKLIENIAGRDAMPTDSALKPTPVE